LTNYNILISSLTRDSKWHDPSYLSAYEDGTECSEMSQYKIQTPGNYPEENMQHSEQGKSLKSRNGIKLEYSAEKLFVVFKFFCVPAA
jgi:hypothetical protein